ncbi:MAG: hypothetical protein GXP34_03040 [Actinobacteria bacterium]|nr:hypothetical protein [Actinomycetota bacterium]
MSSRSWRRRVVHSVRADWSEVGSLGRLAFVGIVLSLVVTIVLGFSIQNATRRHLLAARGQILANVIEEIEAQHLRPSSGPGGASYEAFDQEVRLRLIGGETLRVKLWAPDGTILYSDDPDLVGSVFELSPPALSALRGEQTYNISDTSDPAHADESSVGSLIEFYIPYHDPAGEIIGAFEVEQRIDTLQKTLQRVGVNVWLTIGSGLLLLGGFMLALLLARARAFNLRRRQVESLVGEILKAQENERRRIVGALHDDIGQPLYRLLYGLEGGKSRLPAGSPVRSELDRLEGIVRDIDATLRTELRVLHRGLAEDLGLEAALAQLLDATRQETGLDIDLSVNLGNEPDPIPRSALLRAAQEAVTNIRKHSGAASVSVGVWEQDREVIMEIVDDGFGVKGPRGLGLTTTRERLESIGGGIEVRPRREGGTVFRAWVPLPEPGA